jgi:hypothetical protein
MVAFINCNDINDPNPPPAGPLELMAPKGGESYKVGQTVEIKWKINDESKVASVGIKLSLDNGKSYLVNDLESHSIPSTTTSFQWTITSDQVSSQCIIKVYEYNDASINDKSTAFTISN